jgi:hypothetical protein
MNKLEIKQLSLRIHSLIEIDISKVDRLVIYTIYFWSLIILTGEDLKNLQTFDLY